MADLLKKIEGRLLDNSESTTNLLVGVEGSYGQEDYIKLDGFEAFLQDFSNSVEVIDFNVTPSFGFRGTGEYEGKEISFSKDGNKIIS